jgi:GT2 family glycosyltransferase
VKALNIDIDIIVVTYNSSRWIEGLINSLKNSEFPCQHIHLTFVDNASSDNSVEKLRSYEANNNFASFNIISMPSNLGFGPANNVGVKNSNQQYVFFLNVDTEILPNTISELMSNAGKCNNDVGLWECRQFPYEHPKLYNPVTMETNWSSAAACMVRRDYFTEIGMFDENIFMYAEDVDLSWRFKANGYKTIYVPKSIVYHFTYVSAWEVKPNQFYNSTFNNLMLRYKFGTLKNVLRGYLLFFSLLAIKGPLPNHRRIIINNIFKSIFKGFQFRKWYRKNKKLLFKPAFWGWDYDINRDGAFYVNKKSEENPLVSIIVRTCGRPSVLRETLLSLRNQTFSNFEVVIVEDGPDVSRLLIESEFNDLNYQYYSTKKKVGRCEVGNIALAMAKGQYFNFLDDDDLFYADHIEVLVSSLQKNPDFKAAYSIAFETPIEVISKDPYLYNEISHNVLYKEKFNKLKLLHHNYFPIQTVMFSREFFDKLGGFDPNLEVLEDWDLWIRYGMYGSFLFVDKLTSLYRVPAVIRQNFDRQRKLDEYLKFVREKHSKSMVEISVGEMQKDVEELMNSKNQSIISRIKNSPGRTLLSKVKNKIYFKIKSKLIRK